MKKLIIALAAMLIVGCAGTNFSFDQAARVQPGMTGGQVQQILGKPFMVTTMGDSEIWIYSYANGFGTARSVSFIFKNGTVSKTPTIPASFTNHPAIQIATP